MTMTTSHVPVFYLRKHVYLLLQHANAVIPGCKASIGVQDFAPVLDHAETVFLKENNIHIYKKYDIKSDKVGDTWKTINNYWVQIINQQNNNLRSFKSAVTKKSRLQTDLYHPLLAWDKAIKNKTRPEGDVPVAFALAVCELARQACVKLNDSQSVKEIEYIRGIIDNRNKGRNDIQASEFALRTLNFWRNNTEESGVLPTAFYNTNWICYERTDGKSDDSAQWGIALSDIAISEPDADGYIPISMHSKYVSGETHHRGIISVEPKGGYIVAQLLRDSTPMAMTPAFLVMKLNNVMPDAQSLLIGHFLHYSVFYKHYLTKTVVWAKTDGPFQPQDLTQSSDEFTGISQNIKSFLNNRLRNRLTMPSKEVLTDDQNSLRRWIVRHNKDIFENPTLKAYEGDYFICYYHGEVGEQKQTPTIEDISASLRVDRLKICYDPDSIEFKAEYTHRRGDIAETAYRGIARYSTSTIQLILNEEEENGNDVDALVHKNARANFVHITISTPLVHPVALKDTIKEYDYFPGIVSGLNDDGNTPASFRMAIIKKEKLIGDKTWNINQPFFPSEYLDNSVLQEVIKYFIENVQNLSIKIDLKRR